MRNDADVGVEAAEPGRRPSGFGPPHGGRIVQHLALEVRGLDDVAVHDPDRPDPGGGEVEGSRCPEPSGADEEHARATETELALLAHLGEEQMPTVPVTFGRGEGAGGSGTPRRGGGSSCEGGNEDDPVGGGHRGPQALSVPNVVAVDEDDQAGAQRSGRGEDMGMERRICGDEGAKDLLDSGALEAELLRHFVEEFSERRGKVDDRTRGRLAHGSLPTGNPGPLRATSVSGRPGSPLQNARISRPRPTMACKSPAAAERESSGDGVAGPSGWVWNIPTTRRPRTTGRSTQSRTALGSASYRRRSGRREGSSTNPVTVQLCGERRTPRRTPPVSNGARSRATARSRDLVDGGTSATGPVGRSVTGAG